MPSFSPTHTVYPSGYTQKPGCSMCSLQRKRHLQEGRRNFKCTFIPQVTIGCLAVMAGFLTVFFGAKKPQIPYILGLDMVTGMLSIFAGATAFRISRTHKPNTNHWCSLKFFVTLHCLLTLMCLFLCIGSLAVAGYALYLCRGVFIGSESSKIACQYSTYQNVAMAITDMTLGIVLMTVSIVAFWTFAKHRYIFGLITDVDKKLFSRDISRMKKKMGIKRNSNEHFITFSHCDHHVSKWNRISTISMPSKTKYTI